MSEELKPCPFCGGEARIIGCPQCNEVFVECRSCGVMTGAKLSRGQVILEWNRRAQQPNEPLTLDELKGMLYEPVWVKSLLDGTVKGAVINNTNAAAYVLCGVRYDTFGNYGKTWLAYRSKPEAGEKG